MQKILISLTAHVLVFALYMSMFVPVVSSQKRQVRTEILEGVLGMMVFEETKEAPSHNRYYIEENDGKNRVYTYLSGNIDFLPLFNKKVVLRGTRSDYFPILDQFGAVERFHSMEFEVEAVEKVEANESLSAPGTVLGPLTLPPPTVGERTMIQINVMPANNPTPQYSTEWIRGRLFTDPDSMRNLVTENSYGKYKLKGVHHPAGDVTPWITLTINPSEFINCSMFYNAAWAQADNILEAQGFSKTLYRTRSYTFRNMPECNQTANATVGVFGENAGVRIINIHQPAWFNENHQSAQTGIRTFLHELGHNLGFDHSRGENFDGGTIWEYGDPGDPMGTPRGFWHMFNNINRLKLGWLASTAKFVVIDVRGTSPMKHLQTPAVPTKGIGSNSPPVGYIIPILNTNGTLTDEVYIVERRRNLGLFEVLTSQGSELAQGLSIRRHNVDLTGYRGGVILNSHPTWPCCSKGPVPFGTSFTTLKNVTFNVGYGTPSWMAFTVTLPDYYPASSQEAELSYQEYHRDKIANK